MRKNLQQLEAQNHSLKKEISAMRIEQKELNNLFTKEKSLKKQIEESSTDYKRQITQLHESIRKYKAKNIELEEELKVLKEEATKAETLVKQAEAEKSIIAQDFSTKIVAKEGEITQRNKIIVSLKKQVDGLSNVERIKENLKIVQDRHNQLCGMDTE